MSTEIGPPAAWYRDPSGAHELRWWDGERWTDGVSDRGRLATDPIDPAGAQAAWDAVTDQRVPWPGWVALAAVAAAIVGVLAAAVLAVAVDAAGGGPVATLVAGVVGLYGTLLATCAAVGRRLGTERGLFVDFGLRPRWGDVWRGFLLGLGARVAATVAALVFVLLDRDLGGSNLPTEEELGGDVGVAVAFILMAVVLAPVVEEIFFRGLLQRSLESVLPVWAAVAAASALFGLAHVSIELGAGNVAVVVATGAAGAVFGRGAWKHRRLGPSIFAHAWFNLPAAVAIVYLTS